jgi:type II secretory pathway pseudopilin PulG
MKKLLVAIILIAGLAAVAFASFTNNRKKTTIEKKAEKKENKKTCKHRCAYI